MVIQVHDDPVVKVQNPIKKRCKLKQNISYQYMKWKNTEIHKIHSQLHQNKEKYPCPVRCWPFGIFCGSLLRHHHMAKVKEDTKNQPTWNNL